ncbi:MAG: hypothetical protein AB7N54_03480 [Alphaproteobacteria bacterium]
MDDPPAELLHFTSKDGLLGIVAHGFALQPCDRRLLDDLFGADRPFSGDAQNFGMVCFTEASLHDSAEVRKKGNFAIAMKSVWAVANDVRKVTYVSREEAQASHDAVRCAMDDLTRRIEHPDDEAIKFAYKNKDFAQWLGASKYANILAEYEYMQTTDDLAQREWRVTQHLPFYNQPPRTVPSPEGWGGLLFFKKFQPQDVAFFACHASEVDSLHASLPAEFRSVAIRTF